MFAHPKMKLSFKISDALQQCNQVLIGLQRAILPVMCLVPVTRHPSAKECVKGPSCLLYSRPCLPAKSANAYAWCWMQSVVENQIFPHVANGFADSNAYLRELTLKSMLVLAPKLSQKTINQNLLKYLAKLQVGQDEAVATCPAQPYQLSCLQAAFLQHPGSAPSSAQGCFVVGPHLRAFQPSLPHARYSETGSDESPPFSPTLKLGERTGRIPANHLNRRQMYRGS